MTLYALALLSVALLGIGVIVAIRYRDRWIPVALRRDAKGLDAPDMDEGFARTVADDEQNGARMQ
jgi:hypothetical protein